MPELPEVETIARQLRRHGIEGRTVRSVTVNWARMVEPFSVEAFSEALTGTTIDKISRVGKWLLFSLGSGRTLMVHLRMSGSFSMTAGTHDRIVVELSDSVSLYYSDPRKFGRWKLVAHPDEILKSLGPDALSRSFSLSGFCHDIKRRHRMIKPLLLDQTVVAGLGNIYVDEALWEAQIHPERLSDSLSDDELKLLFKAIKHVLQVGVRNRGTSLGDGKANYRDVDGESGGHREVVKAYGRTGCPCERCGSSLKKITVAQRGTHFCPACQKK
jgi:formamidopyrimidine-DNA glycosylase